jgi:hypothetical protein
MVAQDLVAMDRMRPLSAVSFRQTSQQVSRMLRIPLKSAADSDRSRPPVPIEAGRGFH